MKKFVIVRFDDYKTATHKLNRLRGDVQAASFIELITDADLEANPRVAKNGSVTREIEDCLRESPELFHYKSKGLLLACREVEILERNRVRLLFEDPELEGILDGGHNTLAIARHILQVALGDEAEPVLRKLKTWKDLQPIWAEYQDEIKSIRDELDFLIPLEVIYPVDDANGSDEFTNAILDINRARNNNAQLTESTKANKSGFYEEIKKNLDGDLASDVEWKANDGGRIKSRDLVALSLIPLSVIPPEAFAQDEEGKTPRILENPTVIFSSKGQCVLSYNKVLQHVGVSVPRKGEIVEVTHEGVQSALAMMKDFPKLYDFIYEMMPKSLAGASANFGRITSVRLYDPIKAQNEKESGKRGKSKYLARKAKTKFYRREVDYDYGEGFIMPLVYAFRELIDYKDGDLRWTVDPFKFARDHLGKIMEQYYGMIEGQGYDPAKVGKQPSAYKVAQNAFKMQLILDANS